MKISVDNIEKTLKEKVYEGVFSIDNIPYSFTYNTETKQLDFVDAGDDLEYNLNNTEKKELLDSITTKIEELNKIKEYVPFIKEEPIPKNETERIIYGVSKDLIPEIMKEFEIKKLDTLRELYESRQAQDKVFEKKVRSAVMNLLKSMKDKILNLMTEDYTNDEMKVIIDKIAKYITDNVISNLLQTEYKQISYDYIDGIFEITADEKEAVMTHWFNEDMTGPNREVRVPASEYNYKKEDGIQFVRYDLDKKNFSFYLENEDIIGKRFIINKNNLSNYQGDYKDVIIFGSKASLDLAEMKLLPNDKSNAFIGTANLTADEIMRYHYDEFVSQEKDGKVYNNKYFLGADNKAYQHINDIISESNGNFVKDNYDLYKKEDFLAAMKKGFTVDELQEFYATSYEKLEIKDFIDTIKEFEISGDVYVATIDENEVEIYKNGNVEYSNYFNDREKAQEAFDMLGDALENENDISEKLNNEEER